MMVHAYNLSTQEVNRGGSETQYHPWLYLEIESSLLCIKLCFKTRKEESKEINKEGKKEGRKDGQMESRKAGRKESSLQFGNLVVTNALPYKAKTCRGWSHIPFISALKRHISVFLRIIKYTE